ncbi:hypothetical protein ACSHT0_13230 [Tepidicaulis sp. LMO-SS28]|uniref:hypothetical protein n=1 Tax=Tepidicaulis sp. LMO-SS28 TaxID=3447455 RepID=UPI003EDF5A5F
MKWLKADIRKIESLIVEGSTAALTYAALEGRLAIEKVVYERLQINHKYISPEDLKKWQPKYVVTKLIQEVDANVASSFTLSMSKDPVSPDEEFSQEKAEAIEYVEVGRQVGFDAKRLSKHWQALSSFLHVKVPLSSEEMISSYSDTEILKTKLSELLDLLRPISEGTLIMNSPGEDVYFHCECGVENIRKSQFLTDNQTVNCHNKDCNASWLVRFHDDRIVFEREIVSIKCAVCSAQNEFAKKTFFNMDRKQIAHFECKQCGASNEARWHLINVTPEKCH